MNRRNFPCSCFWRATTVIAVLAASGLLAQGGERTPRQHRKVSFRTLHTENAAAEAYNWSGYAVAAATPPATATTPTGVSVTSVSGSWIVPKATCSGHQTQYAAFWIGIDGWYSDSVEQIGTDSDCSSGSPVYYAWYEFYPESSYYACPASSGNGRHNQPSCPLMSLTPGDVMTASVTYNSNGTFTATIEDVTKGSSTLFSTTYSPNKLTGTPQLSSAEWIAEAPSSGNNILPLADFGTANFSNVTATVNGVTGPIGSFVGATPATWWVCAMVNKSTSLPISYPPPTSDLMALPGPLLNNGTGFSDTWYSVGP